jgi:DNA-binding GntR family transcriptional regulator
MQIALPQKALPQLVKEMPMHSDEMAQLLRRAIREGVLQPGQPLVQEELAKRFNVSRIPVREALRTLTAEGLLVSRPGGGASVVDLTATEVAELWDLRLAIEPTLAFAIVENASPVDLRRWYQFINIMDSQEGDPEAWVRTNYQFHQEMYVAAKKPHTERILMSLYDFTVRYDILYLKEYKRYASLNDEHRDILKAITSRNPQLLSQLITAHFTPLRKTLSERLDRSKDLLDSLRSLYGSIDSNGSIR